MPAFSRQGGWLSQLLLWPLALIGALTVALVVTGVMTYDGSVQQPAPVGNPLVAGSVKDVKLSQQLQDTYARSCQICHNANGAGAPLAGDHAAWQPRLEQGMATLLEHTISGHNGMPPMGMCMDCGQAEFVALIEHMGEFDSGMECE